MERCFACGRPLGNAQRRIAYTSDEQSVFVGSECWQRVVEGGTGGYQPPKGGLRLFLEPPLVRAADKALGLLRQYIADIGGCDHSVGICACGDIRIADELADALNNCRRTP